MTAAALRTTVRPPLPAAAPLVTQEDVDVALMFVVHGQPFTELEARFDLGRSGLGPMSDEAWGHRWGWTARDVDVLRTSNWRTRPELPTPTGAPMPDRPNGREERARESRNRRRSR